jgi:hypothetical protein
MRTRGHWCAGRPGSLALAVSVVTGSIAFAPAETALAQVGTISMLEVDLPSGTPDLVRSEGDGTFSMGTIFDGGVGVSFLDDDPNSFGNDDLWYITLVPPTGQTLVVGSYTGAGRTPTASSPAINFTGGPGSSCTTTTGEFEVIDLDADDRLLATFSIECAFGRGEISGTVAYQNNNTVTGSLTGIARLDGTPRAGVTVAVHRAGESTATQTVVTVADGRYTFSALPIGAYELRMSGTGLPEQWLGGRITRLLSTRAAVVPGSNSAAVNLIRSQGFWGTFTSSAFTPIFDGAVVEIWNDDGTLADTVNVEYAGGGYVYEALVDPGTYRLSGLPNDPDLSTTWYPNDTSFFQAEPLDLATNQVIEAKLVSTQSGVIRITLTSSDDVEIFRPFAFAYSEDNLERRSPVFDTSGFTADVTVSAGDFYVLGSSYAPEFETLYDYFPEWYDGAPYYAGERAKPIPVAPGSIVPITIELDPFFPDMFESVFLDDVFWMGATGISTGCGAAGYCPDDDVTRGQMAAFLVRALRLTESDPNIEFSDDDTSVFQADIERLATAGITSGCGQGIFCPNDPVTRSQMAAFLVRAMGYTDRGSNDFTDDNGNVFEADIERLAAAGVTSGCGPDTFCPNDNVTRGQMAAFLHRALGGGVLYPGEVGSEPSGRVLGSRPALEVTR